MRTLQVLKFGAGALIVIIGLISWWIGTDSPTTTDDSFQIADGFQLDRIAAEPHVLDPVAMDVDARGRIFVAEMPGYPLDVSPTGRIRLLKDKDGDGIIDQSIVYAEGLVLPTGLMAWGNGILVTAPPDVIYLEDTNGDDRADSSSVILTGFARSNPQHNFNKPIYGLDNWIHVANNGTIGTTAYAEPFGDRGSEVYFPAAPNAGRIDRNGNDRNVRFRPNTFEVESRSGRSQFGHTFDAMGRHFLVSNAEPQFHEVIAARYLERNPALPWEAMQYTPAYGRNTTIYPITDTADYQLLTDRGMLTSAAGITYALGGLFPPAYQNVTFVGEPVHNLVHVLRVVPQGSTFQGQRVEERSEFLASKDSWFRPVNFFNGPDGALYMVDYHRGIVEHPEWMDDAMRASDKLQEGQDKGRIYRIAPEGFEPTNWIGRLDLQNASSSTLVDHLSHENIWWRRTSQRLLVDRQDQSIVAALVEMVNQDASAVGRVHALWTLEGLGALTADIIIHALQDEDAGIRENAIILSEALLDDQAVVDALLTLTGDANTRVQFQLLCTLGFLESDAALQARQTLLRGNLSDSWFQVAALSSSRQSSQELIELAIDGADENAVTDYIERLGRYAVVSGDIETMAPWLQELFTAPATSWHPPLLNGLAAGLRQSRSAARSFDAHREAITAGYQKAEDADRQAAFLALLEQVGLPAEDSNVLQEAVASAQETAKRSDADISRRQSAISFLALHNPDQHLDLFKSLIGHSQPQPVQESAVHAIRHSQADDLPAFFLDQWAQLTPSIRQAAVDVMITDIYRPNPPRTTALLDAVEQGIVQPSALGWDRVVRLMRDTNGPLKSRARQLLSTNPAEREQIVKEFEHALTLEGDIGTGQAVFERVCSACHQVAGQHGISLGPDLGTVRHWTARQLLADILLPQKTIADGYGLWRARLEDGSQVAGVLETESLSTITLKQTGGATSTLNRDDIAALENLPVSLMPEGLEQQLSDQEMADLIAYLRFN